MSSEHVLVRLSQLRLPKDLDDAVRRLCRQWDDLMIQLEAMTPGDPAAHERIVQGFKLRESLAYILGPSEAVDLGLHQELHHLSLRLTGVGHPPSFKRD